MQPQYIILPWDLKRWPEIKQKLSQDINNIVDLDNRICGFFAGKLRPRSIIELFTKYAQGCAELPPDHGLPSIDEFISRLVPLLRDLVLNGPKLFKDYPVRALGPNARANICITRPQAAAIIACAFFGLLNYNYLTKGRSPIEIFPEMTFINIYSTHNVFALQCLANYFERVYRYINAADENTRDIFDVSQIIIYRNCLKLPPKWELSQKPICDVALSEGNIDGSSAKLHVDFATDFLCGNTFNDNLTPEEILFLVRPECLIAVLLCARINDNESVAILGAEKISDYNGYGSNVKFAGNFIDDAPRGFSPDNTQVMIQNITICIDATRRTSGVTQYMQDFDRDLNKAYCGFGMFNFSSPAEPIATGAWGCGPYGGNMCLKFIQQLLAASEANKSLIYHANNKPFESQLICFLGWLQKRNPSVGELYTLYKQLIKKCYTGPYSRLSELDIFECLQDS